VERSDLHLPAVAQVIEERCELRLRGGIRVGHDLQGQSLVPGFKALSDDPTDVGYSLIAIPMSR
jgi:hypothetical protein